MAKMCIIGGSVGGRKNVQRESAQGKRSRRWMLYEADSQRFRKSHGHGGGHMLTGVQMYVCYASLRLRRIYLLEKSVNPLRGLSISIQKQSEWRNAWYMHTQLLNWVAICYIASISKAAFRTALGRNQSNFTDLSIGEYLATLVR